MHELIISPQLDNFVIVHPGQQKALRISREKYNEVADAARNERPVPKWLKETARKVWGVELSGQATNRAVIVRPSTPHNYARATYEINKGCNFSCEHCYLAERKFEGLPRPEKSRLIALLRDVGVLRIQFTGGEPMIDRDFAHTYEEAFRAGMLIDILTNGSRLHRPDVHEMFKAMPPQKVVVSLYGATAESFDALTRKPGAFQLVMKGLTAAREAGTRVELSLIITRHNAHEADAMRSLADEFATTHKEYANISPTYDGQSGPLATQAPGFLDKTAIFQGCPAGHTFFHVDPHGFATMCKIGRENPIDLMAEGLDGLNRLPGIADAQMLRTGGCSGCQLSDTCRVCRPLAKVYQVAKAPLESYCQHGNGGAA
ncbi:radical SAM protein [Streptomyces xiamenensis]|uniref:radical SAM protein n=1 Tax=Streptomyces xiamenensis TaxID=408015 RepID=UPI003D70D8CD